MNRYTLSIILGMVIIILTGDLQGTIATIGVASGSAIIFASLLTNALVYHEDIMRSDAPGAVVYQHIMNLDKTIRNLMGRRPA